MFLLLGTCSDPRAPWLREQAGAAGAPALPVAAQGVHFVDAELIPADAWAADQQRSSNPIYAALEQAERQASAEQRAALRQDLDRLALIRPAPRFVLVDTASGRLWMIEGGRIAGTMKVITGKAGMETPMMAALIRHAVLNPYWNLPPDLVREHAALDLPVAGPAWLRRQGLQAVASYRGDAEPIDAEAVDWPAVAAGEASVGLRQAPGPFNTMGAVKFMFPNRLGIYLHDTPDRALFRAVDRRFSSGCVRLEDAAALYRWLLGRGLPPPDPAFPELRVPLPEPVPVYILELPSLRPIASQIIPSSSRFSVLPVNHDPA
jgi:murein L,D-transpeptidase YcbB/YkuD